MKLKTDDGLYRNLDRPLLSSAHHSLSTLSNLAARQQLLCAQNTLLTSKLTTTSNILAAKTSCVGHDVGSRLLQNERLKNCLLGVSTASKLCGLVSCPTTSFNKRHLSFSNSLDENELSKRKRLVSPFDATPTSHETTVFEPSRERDWSSKFSPCAVPDTDKMPSYSFSLQKELLDESERVAFGSEERLAVQMEKDFRTETKVSLMRAVSSSLIAGPNMKDRHDNVRMSIIGCARAVAEHSPEFVLKVALYTRKELNIRTTSNLLLAFAAFENKCRPYLMKYFCATVVLPSDWIDVAEQYQLMKDKNIKPGSLPSALRRCMVAKFPEFDTYQLGKYNKEKKGKKKKKKLEKVESDPDEPSFARKARSGLKVQKKKYENKTFSLKQLVRMLHITRPADHVMSLIGKRYPSDAESFRKSGLLGSWEEARAGKRMKLPTPETWETQVSLKGNAAPTWQKLIDDKKLPFMASLRNLRNMILAGISESHHQTILKLLTSERAVGNSRQFPFRFLSAYQIMDELETRLKDNANSVKSVQRGKGRKVRSTKIKGKAKFLKKVYNVTLLNRYRAALNEAINLATMLNVPPIPGTTIVLCDVRPHTNANCTTARGLGKPKTVREMSLLLGLMCQSACENSQLILFGTAGHKSIAPSTESLLSRLEILNAEAEDLNSSVQQDVQNQFGDILMPLLHDEVNVNNLVILSNSSDHKEVKTFLTKYRKIVNPHLLFVSVDLAGTLSSQRTTSTDNYKHHPNDVWLGGFSDQLLRFVAERGGLHQLHHVEATDERYKLQANIPQQSVELVPRHHRPGIRQPRWRTVRVFISSTFRDMHGERDLLVRYIFPELRARAQSIFLDVHEVDLRWGITEEEAEDNKALEVCIQEASRCDLFVGLLGSRYGHVISPSEIPTSVDFDWVRNCAPGASITELEFHAGAFSRTSNEKKTAFFYIRNDNIIRYIPQKWRNDFLPESEAAKSKLVALKQRVLRSGFPVYDGYPCEWGGAVDKRPILEGLQPLGERLIHDLWSGLVYLRSSDDENKETAVCDADSVAQSMIAAHHLQSFVGRKRLVEQIVEYIQNKQNSLLVLSGKSGSGKTATMAYILQKLRNCLSIPVVGYFIDATANSYSVANMLQYLCQEISVQRKREWEHADNQNKTRIVGEFLSMITTTIKESGRLILVLDGLDALESGSLLTWMPDPIPEGLTLLVSVTQGTPVQTVLSRRHATFLQIPPLSLTERGKVIKRILAPFRKVLTESLGNNQLHLLTSKSEAGRPLYLFMACRELRMFGSFEMMTEKLHQLPPTLVGLLQSSIERLCREYGVSLVAVVLGLLGVAKDGLLEEELWYLASLHLVLSASTAKSVRDVYLLPNQMLPRAILAQMVHDLDGFVSSAPTGGKERLLTLSHAEVTKTVTTYCQKTELEERQLHELLAGYYQNEADPSRDSTWMGKSSRPYSLLVYHLVKGGCYEEAYQKVTDLLFLAAKAKQGLADAVLEDYNLVEKIVPKSPHAWHYNFVEYREFVRRSHHVLAASPALVLQQALNEPTCTAPALDSEELLGTSAFANALQWLNKPVTTHSCVGTLVHTEPVTCVAVSCWEPVVAFGTGTGGVLLYNLAEGKEGHVFHGHSESVTKVLFVGRFSLCSASKDGTCSLWDLQMGNRIAVMSGHKKLISDCCCDSDATVLASVSWDCTLRTWNARSGQEVSVMKEKKPINCVAFNPCRAMTAIGLWDCSIRLWDLQTVKRKAILRGHESSVKSVTYSPCGDYIASAAQNGEVRLWSSLAGLPISAFEAHKTSINQLIFVHEGTGLATVGDDHALKVWGSVFGTERTVLQRHSIGKMVVMAFSESGRNLIAVDNNSDVIKVDFQTGTVLFTTKPSASYVTAISVTESLNRIFVGYTNEVVKVIDGKTGKVQANLTGFNSAVTAIYSGTTIVLSGTLDGMLAIHSLPVKFHHSASCQDIPATNIVKAHTGQVTCIVVDDVKRYCVSVSRDRSIKVWTLMKKSIDLELLMSYEGGHSDWINTCMWIFDYRTRYIVTGSNDCTVKLWRLQRGREAGLEEVCTVGSAPGPVVHVSVWGMNIVCGSVDGTIQMYTMKGVKLTSISGQRSNCFAAAVSEADSPKSDWYQMSLSEELGEDEIVGGIKWPQVVVASGHDSGMVKSTKLLWEEHGQTLSGHTDRVLGIARFENKLVSCSSDMSVRSWLMKSSATDTDTHTWHRTAVTAMDWCNARGIMLSADQSGFVVLWKKSPNALYPQRVCSAQGHPKCITDVCFTFVAHELVGFCTVSTDGYITFWTTDGSTSMTKTNRTHTMGVPLTSINYSPLEDVVVAGGWNSLIVVCNARTGDQLYTHGSPSSEWMMHAKFAVESGGLCVVVANTRGAVGMQPFKTYEPNWKTVFKFETTEELSLVLPTCMTLVPPSGHHRQAPWWFLGLSNGNLMQKCYSSDETETNLKCVKVHSSDVVACEYIEERELLITASKDSSLKLFRVEDTLHQVAQFECQAPITSLVVLEREPRLKVACGDCHGHIEFIEWVDAKVVGTAR